MEGVGGAESCVELVPGAFIDEEIDVLLGGNAAMVPAVGAHVERTDEPVLDVDVPTLVAFLPGVGWNLQLYPFRRAGLTLFFEPGHSRHSGELEGDNLGGAFPGRQSRPRNSPRSNQLHVCPSLGHADHQVGTGLVVRARHSPIGETPTQLATRCPRRSSRRAGTSRHRRRTATGFR